MADKATPKVTRTLEEANEAGYLGWVPDPTPNSAYTIAGVTSGAKTPETQEPGLVGSTKSDPGKVGVGTPGR